MIRKSSFAYEKKSRLKAALLAVWLAAASVGMSACGQQGSAQSQEGQEQGGAQSQEGQEQAAAAQADVTDTIPLQVIDDNYRTYYEVFVYSFCDSDGDGIGDLQGLLSRLDYINDGDDTTDTDLGCNGLWLMPVHPSPTYHKYDVTDYYAIDPQYGTLEDFQALLDACDARDQSHYGSGAEPYFLAASVVSGSLRISVRTGNGGAGRGGMPLRGLLSFHERAGQRLLSGGGLQLVL